MPKILSAEEHDKRWNMSGRALEGLEINALDGWELPSNRIIVAMDDVRHSEILWTPQNGGAIVGRIVKLGREPLTAIGVPLQHEVAVGDRVLVSRHDGIQIKWDGKQGLILRETEILGIVDEEPSREGES